jgi:hypothetical protein
MNRQHTRISTFIDIPELELDTSDDRTEAELYQLMAKRLLRAVMLQLNTYEQPALLEALAIVIPGMLDQVRQQEPAW